VAEIAEQLDTTPEQVLDARAAAGARHAAWLESPIFDGDDSRATFGDVIGALDDGLDAAEAAVTAQRLQRNLSERDRELLRLRFGEDLTQREIGISQMQVSRLIRRSLCRRRDSRTSRPGPSAH
jgi:RNA polymerase sigma-B factor